MLTGNDKYRDSGYGSNLDGLLDPQIAIEASVKFWIDRRLKQKYRSSLIK